MAADIGGSNPLQSLLGAMTRGKQKHPSSPEFKREAQSKKMTSFKCFGLGVIQPTIQNTAITGDVRSDNYALMVISVLNLAGIQPLQNQLTDFGLQGSATADMTEDSSDLSSFMSYIEGASEANLSKFWETPANVKALKKAAGLYQRLFVSGVQNIPMGIKDPSNPTLSEISIEINGTMYKGTSPCIVQFLKDAVDASGVPFDPKKQLTAPLSDLNIYILRKLQVQIDAHSSGTININALKSVYDVSGDNAIVVGVKETYQKFAEKVIKGSASGSFGYYLEAEATNSIYQPLGTLEVAVSMLADNYQKANKASSISSGNNGTILAEVYASLSDMKNLFQGQSQIITNSVQTRTSQITSFMKIGQSILSGVDKATKFKVLGTRA